MALVWNNKMKKWRNIALVVLAAGIVAWALFSRRSDPNALLTAGLLPLDVEYVSGPPVIENQPTLIDFWATWCGPCLETIPHVNALYSKYGGQGLQVIGISPEEPQVVKHFLENFQIDYAVAVDEETTYFTVLGIRGIPHLVLLNSDGTIAWRGHPMELNEKVIEDALKAGVPAG